MKVLKFGGTSVGSVSSLRNVKQIVEQTPGQVIVVVSAMSGVTDQLLAMASQAIKQDDAWELTLQQLHERHIATMQALVPPERQQQCLDAFTNFIDGGLRQYYGMLQVNRQLTAAQRDQLTDQVVCHGEILSSIIVSSMISGAVPHFSPHFIKTRDTATERLLDAEATERLIRQEFSGSQQRVHVTQGFISADVATGQKTNLGRGGSDFTAALIAAALDAESLEIWTDVDGFMTADPKKDPTATVIPRMTFDEAQRMCDAGAKVVYAPTLTPVRLRGIGVWVKNTFNPTAPGTLIAD